MVRTYKSSRYKSRGSNVCISCRTMAAGTSRTLTFDYNNFRITVKKDAITCEICAKRFWIEMFERYLKDSFSYPEKRRPILNWDKTDVHSDSTIVMLCQIGILKGEFEGYMLFSGSTNLNPKHLNVPFGFVFKKDAIAYAETYFSHENWVLTRFSKPLKRGEFALSNLKKREKIKLITVGRI